MKKIGIILLIILFNSNLSSQVLPLDSETGKITYTEVAYVDDSTTTKDQLYSVAREWFARTFKSSNDVLQMDDRKAGKLIGKGSFEIEMTPYLTESYVEFTISIYVKNGKYKYEFTDFYHISFKPGYSGGALEDEKPDCGGMRMTKKGWKQVKEQTSIKIPSFISYLKSEMNKIAQKDESW